MVVAVGDKACYVSGRKEVPVVLFGRVEDAWEQIHVQGLKPFGESASAVVNDCQVIFFGGIRFYQPGISSMVNHVQILNLKEKHNKVIKFDEDQVQPRAFHTQCIYGDFLIISGGLNKNYKTLNNFMIYNFKQNYWNQLKIP